MIRGANELHTCRVRTVSQGVLSLLRGLCLFIPMVLSSTPALAIQCAELSEYTEIWLGEETGWPVPLYGRGTAESGEPCSITVRTYIKSPTGVELASAYGQGSVSAQSTVVINLDENSQEGSYTVSTEGWSQGIHYGCSMGVAAAGRWASRFAYIGYDNGYFYSRDNCPHQCQANYRRIPTYYGLWMAERGVYVEILGIGACRRTWRGSGEPGAPCFGPQ